MGGAEYIKNLVRALAAAGADAPTVFCLEEAKSDWTGITDRIVTVRSRARWPLADRLGVNNRHFAEALRGSDVNFLFPLTYANWENIGLTFPLKPTLRKTRWAGWIPDFQHRFLPKFFTPAQIAFRDRGVEQLLAEAETIVMSSHTAAADLSRLYPNYSGRVEVLQFATCAPPEWYADYHHADLDQLPKRFLLVCNQFWQHKNHLTLFQALAHLAETGIRPTLLCTGAIQDERDPEYATRIRQALAEGGIADQVHLLGLVPRRLQIELIRRAVCVVQPSLFEGWSTVVEDARVFHRPILLSDLAVHREQAPPGAVYFSPESVEELSTAIADAWSNLQEGPDVEAERRAQSDAAARLRRVGERMLEIAAQA